MSITVEQFKVRFPEFAGIKNSTVQEFIDESVLFVNESSWGGKYALGLMYYTAHNLFLATKSSSTGNAGKSAVGVISSKSVDGVSVSYASPSTSTSHFQNFMGSTIYGQKYIMMSKTLGVQACVI